MRNLEKQIVSITRKDTEIILGAGSGYQVAGSVKQTMPPRSVPLPRDSARKRDSRKRSLLCSAYLSAGPSRSVFERDETHVRLRRTEQAGCLVLTAYSQYKPREAEGLPVGRAGRW